MAFQAKDEFGKFTVGVVDCFLVSVGHDRFGLRFARFFGDIVGNGGQVVHFGNAFDDFHEVKFRIEAEIKTEDRDVVISTAAFAAIEGVDAVGDE